MFFRCSGMFRDVPECSMFHVPAFIEGPQGMTARLNLKKKFKKKHKLQR